MELYQPQIELEVTSTPGAPDQYSLIATTECETSNYFAAGHEPIPSNLDAAGVWQIGLLIAIDPLAPETTVRTRVTHNVNLGSLPGQNPSDDDIKVTIIEDIRTESNKPKGSTTVSSSTASEKDRPFTPQDFMNENK